MSKPVVLHALWWTFSPWWRRLGTPQRADKYISQVAEREQVSNAQAFALVYGNAPAIFQSALRDYKEHHGIGASA